MREYPGTEYSKKSATSSKKIVVSAHFPDCRQLAQNLILYASQNSICAGIVARAALFSEGGWDAFSKTPTASNSVICFRVELHLEPEPTRHRCADSRTAKCHPSPCGGSCSRWDRWRSRNGKSDGNRRILLSSQRSENVEALVPATPGDFDDTNDLRGTRVAARGRTNRFRSLR